MRFAKLLLGLSLAFAALPAWAQEERTATDCFFDAFTHNDADAVAACYAPDATLWIPGAPKAKGQEQSRAMLAGWFAANTVKTFTYNQLGTRTLGDDRVTWGEFTLVVAAKDTGVETASRGRYTDVSRKIDGKWVYLVDHASDDPPAPAVEATP
jgi:uncharacterized protein (TIGR02246 family)